MRTNDWSELLPGGELVREGLADLTAGSLSVNACLASIASPRLTRKGLIPNSAKAMIKEPERELYRLLRAKGGDAYARYNSLLRELASFENALDRMPQEEASKS